MTITKRKPRILSPTRVLEVDEEVLRTYPHSKKVGNYLIGRTLGRGSFATVAEAMHTLTGELVAMKIVDKAKCQTDAYVRKNLRREGRILQQLRHTNLVQLYEILETEHSYYLALELCPGELLNRILERRRLPEQEVRRLVRELVLAVDYMQRAGVLHRDLKVENILLSNGDHIKVIDFGLSTQVRLAKSLDGPLLNQLCRTQCGSPAYAAPEVLSKKPYGFQADVWSIGVNMYAMLVGSLPFSVQPFNIKALCQKMMEKQMNPVPSDISPACLDLLHKLLDPVPEQRLTIQKVMRHPWLKDDSLPPLQPSPFPNWLHLTEIYPEIARFMNDQHSLSRAETDRNLLGNAPSTALATYYLLLRRAQRYCQEHGLSFPHWITRNMAEAKIRGVGRTLTFAETTTTRELTSSEPQVEPTPPAQGEAKEEPNSVATTMAQQLGGVAVPRRLLLRRGSLQQHKVPKLSTSSPTSQSNSATLRSGEDRVRRVGSPGHKETAELAVPRPPVRISEPFGPTYRGYAYHQQQHSNTPPSNTVRTTLNLRPSAPTSTSQPKQTSTDWSPIRLKWAELRGRSNHPSRQATISPMGDLDLGLQPVTRATSRSPVRQLGRQPSGVSPKQTHQNNGRLLDCKVLVGLQPPSQPALIAVGPPAVCGPLSELA